LTKRILFPTPEGDEGGGKLSTARSKLDGYYLQKEYYFPLRGGMKGEDFLYFFLRAFESLSPLKKVEQSLFYPLPDLCSCLIT